MIRFILAAILLSVTTNTLYAQEVIVEPQRNDTLGIMLENYDYPYPVHYMHTSAEGKPVQIAYMDVKPTSWNGKNVLLLHGKNFPAAYWGGTIKSLTAAGYRVVAPDALGFGKSSKPILKEYTFDLLAGITRQLLDTLGITNTAVIGHSTGGMLAAKFALNYPEMVTRLILEDPVGLEDYKAEGATTRFDDWYMKEKNGTYKSISDYQKHYYANWSPDYQQWADVQYKMTRGRNADQLARVNALTYLMIVNHPVIHDYPKIEVPTLMIYGKNDHTKITLGINPAVAHTMGNYSELAPRAAAMIPNAQVIGYNNTGHIAHLENAVLFTRDVKQFLDNTDLQLVYEDPSYQLTGVAISKEGRMFVNYPYWSKEHKYSVVEVKPDGTAVPYPDATWNNWKNGEQGKDKWVCVQAVYVDDRNTLWVVDPASPMQKGVYDNSNKLVQIDLAANKVVRIYPLSSIAGKDSYINDVRVDTKSQTAYLSNSSTGGIVVLDLKTGEGRMVLTESKAVHADPDYVFTVDGQTLRQNGQSLHINSDGIALTSDGNWLIFKPLTDQNLYRIQTQYLKDANMNTNDLNNKVEKVGTFVTTDGMITDDANNLYMGDIEKNTIVKVSPGLTGRTDIITDRRLMWPDSYAISNDGYLYVSCSQIENMSKFHNGVNMQKRPYTIYKIKLPVSAK